MRTSLRGAWERRFGIGMVVLALLAGGLYYDDVRDQERRSRCQSQLNERFAENIVKRSAVSVASDKADKALLLGVAELLSEPQATSDASKREQSARFLALFVGYRQSAVDVDKLRAENPYPDIEGTC